MRSHRRTLSFVPLAAALVFVTLSAAIAGERTARSLGYNVREYGATGDGETLDTKPIQSATLACAENGGGTVLFPAGTFLSGTLYLTSNVTLEVSAGCTSLGSKELTDHRPTVQVFRSYTDSYTDKSLIFGEGLENIAVVGRGIIDGKGQRSTGRTRCGLI